MPGLDHHPGIAHRVKRPWRKFPLWFALTALLLSPIAVWIVDRTLAPAARTLEGSDYQSVQLTFSGQQAILQGEVRSPRAREAASHFAATQIRVGPRWWNGTLNPIASVRNELQLSPPGFVLLLRHGQFNST